MQHADQVADGAVGAGAAPREISYSWSAKTRAAKALIKTIENITGRPRLLRLAKGYEQEVEAGRSFWEVMQNRYGIDMEFVGGGMENIPADGPMVVVANHPYGILDGMAMGRILHETREDFRIIAHVVFRRAEDLKRIILPIDFGESKAALARNLATRKAALSYLGEGGAVGIFPGGTVSTAAQPFSKVYDPHWKTFTAKMVAKSEAQVVPIYFHGRNSRIFQIAGHLNNTLRTALMISEFESRVGERLKITIGKPLPRAEIKSRASDGRAMMEYLRQATYALSPDGAREYPNGLYLG